MAHVNVFIRQRPTCGQQTQQYSTRDTTEGVHIIAKKEGSQNEKEITLDGFWDMASSQENVFQQVGKPSCDRALSGYNATAICFGPTGSGKTFTIFGEQNQLGLVPRMIDYIFQQKQLNSQVEFQFYASFVEIYLDNCYDLLQDAPHSRPSSAQQNRPPSANEDERKRLKLKQAITGEFYAENLTVKNVKTVQDLKNLLKIGLDQRKTFSTNLNERSSRSHAIFSIGIIQKNRVSGISIASLLTCVDLAGSESLKKSGSEGQRLLEAATVNKSLLTLGSVVSALAQNSQHIPYRDNKLTKLLQEALGGSSFTVMICCLYPLLENSNESMQTLNFANRCRNIITQPKCGVVDLSDVEQASRVKVLLEEIEQLKASVNELKCENDKLKNSIIDGYSSTAQSQLPFSYQADQSLPNKTLNPKQPLQANVDIKQQQSQVQQQGQQDKPTYESIQQLRSKLEQKSKEAQESYLAQKQLEQDNKNLISRYQVEIIKLKQHIQEIQTSHSIELKNMSLECEQRLSHALEAQAEISKSQSTLLNQINSSYKSKNQSPQGKNSERILSEYRPFDDSAKTSQRTQLIMDAEQMKIDTINRCDQQKTKELDELKTFMQRQMDAQKLQFEQKIELLNQNLDSDRQYFENLSTVLIFFAQEHKNLVDILNDAKEGKMEAYALNEQDLMKQCLTYDFSKPKQRHKIRVQILVDQQREPRLIPQEFHPILDSIVQSYQQDKQQLLLSKYPDIKQKQVPNGFIQPLMKTNFNIPKPPPVTLDMDIHISPRPKTAFRQASGNMEQFNQKRPQSAQSQKQSSMVGSCGGSGRLVEKKYQQWGW